MGSNEASEALVLGCVMGWVGSNGSRYDELVPIDARMSAVFEYCPAQVVTVGRITVTKRMEALFATGFRPIALVCSDLDSSQLSIRAENGVSDMVRSQLAEEAEAIFDVALDD